MMQKQNFTLCITPQNQVYEGEIYVTQSQLLKSSLSNRLSTDQLLARYLRFSRLHKDWATQQKLILTLKIHEEYLELTYEPLTTSSTKEIQGELPVELYLRYGRDLTSNDFKQLLHQLKDGVVGSLNAY